MFGDWSSAKNELIASWLGPPQGKLPGQPHGMQFGPGAHAKSELPATGSCIHAAPVLPAGASSPARQPASVRSPCRTMRRHASRFNDAISQEAGGSARSARHPRHPLGLRRTGLRARLCYKDGAAQIWSRGQSWGPRRAFWDPGGRKPRRQGDGPRGRGWSPGVRAWRRAVDMGERSARACSLDQVLPA